jgi:hypothetical protein
MYRNTDKTSKIKTQAVAGSLFKQSSSKSTVQIEDKRPGALAQIKLQNGVSNSAKVMQLSSVQEAANNRLPDIRRTKLSSANQSSEIIPQVVGKELSASAEAIGAHADEAPHEVAAVAAEAPGIAEADGAAVKASGLGVIVDAPDEVFAELVHEAATLPAEPFPSRLPQIKNWDKKESHHRATDKAIIPFHERWASKDNPRGIGKKIPMEDAIGHLERNKRFFSHELPREYLPFAIAQGGVQSGYNTTRALNMQPRRDGGRPQHNFVFTRQLPPDDVKSTLDDGQVGAGADAMIVFKSSMFKDPKQPALFKDYDGGFKAHTAPPSAFKATHIKSKSDQIEQNSDRIYQANQEQAVLGSIALRHIAIIVLKENTEDMVELEARKKAFISRLKATPIATQMPPSAARGKIDRDIQKYDAWKKESKDDTLYTLLKKSTNREPEDIIIAVFSGTKRSEVRNKAHRALNPNSL